MIGSGVDVCIRDFDRRSIRIRETRRVKVGRIATGISDQVTASRLPHALMGPFLLLFLYICLMLMAPPFFFFRSPRGFSPWKPSGAGRYLTTRRCRSRVWSSAVFPRPTSAPPGGGGSETECWRRDRETPPRGLAEHRFKYSP